MKYVEKICEYCSKSIKIVRARDRFKRFCGRGCSSKFLFKKPMISCPICHKEMSQTKYRKFCSAKCRTENQKSKYKKTCKYCGKEFILHNRAYENRGRGFLCSNECRHKYNRKDHFNEFYFQTIDTEEKAYWFGFIMADGYNSGYELVINLNKKDDYHLRRFLSDIKSNSDLVYKDRNIVTLRLASKRMCKHLNDLGCVKAKSLIVKYPNWIDYSLQRHFIRGYFDGDGCICASGRRKHLKRVIFYSGSVCFINDLQGQLEKFGIQCNRQKDRSFLCITRQELVEKVLKLMYSGTTVYLERKIKRANLPISLWKENGVGVSERLYRKMQGA